eukprot:scaffold1259_cov25-Attheya_sp.AAC.1
MTRRAVVWRPPLPPIRDSHRCCLDDSDSDCWADAAEFGRCFRRWKECETTSRIVCDADPFPFRTRESGAWVHYPDEYDSTVHLSLWIKMHPLYHYMPDDDDCDGPRPYYFGAA